MVESDEPVADHPTSMAEILAFELAEGRAALWPVGQAGFVLRGGGVSVAIDPYLSDSVGRVNPDFGRAFATPIRAEELQVDIFIVTHDHLDHLDPETVASYTHLASTTFVAPRLSCRKLLALGVPAANLVRIDSGEEAVVRGVRVQGVYALPNGPDVIDTCGYRLEFAGGRSVYHCSDTSWSDLVGRAAPRAEVLLATINGKYGNLNVHEAVRLAKAVRPRIAVPMHYDLMRLNSENPETFRHFMKRELPECQVRILKVMETLVW